MITRKILNWCEEKREEVYADDRPISYVQTFGLGAIEGFIDGWLFNGVLLTAATTIAFIANKSKK